MFYGARRATSIAIPCARPRPSILSYPLFAFALTPVLGAVAGLVIGLVMFRGRALYFSLLTLGSGPAHLGGRPRLAEPHRRHERHRSGVFAAELDSMPSSTRISSTGSSSASRSSAPSILFVITRSPFGDALRGIRENRRRAEFAGLWVKRYELTAFVIAGHVRLDRREVCP